MEMDHTAIEAVARLLAQRTGQKLSASRQWRIPSALSSLMRDYRITSNLQLTHMLSPSGDRAFAQAVVEALLNNETYFFRDRAVFDHISRRILPELSERRRATRRLSLWSVGCSTGQEPLSLAMLFAEQRARWAGWSIDILGTDVSARAISAAREGFYTQFEIQRGLGVGQMLSFFEEEGKGWRVNATLRDMVRYHTHNLLEVPPASDQFDLVLCRNVLLYFDPETRSTAFENIARAMAPDGYLLLGGGETVVGQTDRLRLDPDNAGFYVRRSSLSQPDGRVING